MLERLSADKSVGQYDTVRVRKDGVAVGASVTAIPLFDEQQKVVGAVQIARDLGQQKSTRSEQPDVEQRYRMAFEHAPVGIAQVSLETGEILQANQRLSQILGYVKGDLIHRRLADLIHPEDWHVEEQLLRQMQEGTLSTYTIEKRYLRANAQQAWARVTATRLDDGTGRPTRLSVVCWVSRSPTPITAASAAHSTAGPSTPSAARPSTSASATRSRTHQVRRTPDICRVLRPKA